VYQRSAPFRRVAAQDNTLRAGLRHQLPLLKGLEQIGYESAMRKIAEWRQDGLQA
jgi:hypothetical protein